MLDHGKIQREVAKALREKETLFQKLQRRIRHIQFLDEAGDTAWWRWYPNRAEKRKISDMHSRIT